jgi:hypothetical protein
MAKKHTIESPFSHDHAKRRAILDRARLCAALTKPGLLTAEDQQSSDKLPETYQSEGARGLTNLEGRMLLALYPPDTPWFHLDLAPDVRYDPAADPESLQDMLGTLFLHELQVQATLEAQDLDADHYRVRSGFRSQKRKALSQIICTGETLEQLTDDFRVKVYGRAQYVTCRDGEGAVLYHIVVEEIDPLSLDPDMLAKAELPAKFRDTECGPAERMMKLYTMIEWQPQTNMWLIQQELNKRIIERSEEPISPFFCTTFDLAPGEEDYARGFIEMNLGDLRSHNELEQKLLDFAALHSKQLIAKDYSSLVRDTDLAKDSGSIMQARVNGGEVQDVAIFGPSNAANFEVVYQTSQAKKKSLAAAMLLESAIQPQKERVTALQVQRIAMELEGALGGFYTPIADDQQGPLVRRTIWQLQQKNLLPKLPEKAVQLKLLTGIAAISREASAGKLMELMQVLAPLGPDALRRLNIPAFVKVYMRYRGIHEPNVIKTEEQVAKEVQQAIQANLAQAAGEKAIDTIGNVAEQQAAPQGQ